MFLCASTHSYVFRHLLASVKFKFTNWSRHEGVLKVFKPSLRPKSYVCFGSWSTIENLWLHRRQQMKQRILQCFTITDPNEMHNALQREAQKHPYATGCKLSFYDIELHLFSGLFSLRDFKVCLVFFPYIQSFNIQGAYSGFAKKIQVRLEPMRWVREQHRELLKFVPSWKEKNLKNSHCIRKHWWKVLYAWRCVRWQKQHLCNVVWCGMPAAAWRFVIWILCDWGHLSSQTLRSDGCSKFAQKVGRKTQRVIEKHATWHNGETINLYSSKKNIETTCCEKNHW